MKQSQREGRVGGGDNWLKYRFHWTGWPVVKKGYGHSADVHPQVLLITPFGLILATVSDNLATGDLKRFRATFFRSSDLDDLFFAVDITRFCMKVLKILLLVLINNWNSLIQGHRKLQLWISWFVRYIIEIMLHRLFIIHTLQRPV